jgi:hypothetical protein
MSSSGLCIITAYVTAVLYSSKEINVTTSAERAKHPHLREPTRPKTNLPVGQHIEIEGKPNYHQGQKQAREPGP